MKAAILILLSCISVCISYVHAQPPITFNKAIYCNAIDAFAFSLLDIDSGYITLTDAYDSSYDEIVVLTKFDLHGNSIYNKKISKAGYSYGPGSPGTLIKTYDGGYAFGGYVGLSTNTNEAKAMLVKYNYNGDTEWIRNYSYNDSGGPATGCIQTRDSGFVIISSVRVPGNNFDYNVIRTDKNGKLLWQKTYGTTTYEVGINIYELARGGFAIGGVRYTGGYNYTPWFLKIDDTGKILTQVIFNTKYTTSNSRPSVFRPTNDGGYITWGWIDTLAGNGPSWTDSLPCYIAKLDSNFNILWKTFYHHGAWVPDYAIIYNARQTLDSGYIMCGEQPGSNYGFIAKVDKNGNKLWQQFYYYCSGWNYLTDIAQTSDRGYVFAGSTFDTISPVTQDIWLLKLDSNGVLSTGINNIAASQADIQLYPNPTNYSITLDMPYMATCTISDITGRQLQTITLQPGQQKILLDKYANGIYFLDFIPTGSGEYIVKKIVVQK